MRIYHRARAEREGAKEEVKATKEQQKLVQANAHTQRQAQLHAHLTHTHTHWRAKVHVILWREQAPLPLLLLPRSCNLQLELKLQVVWGMLQLLLLLQLHNNNKKNNSRVVNKSQLHTHTDSAAIVASQRGVYLIFLYCLRYLLHFWRKIIFAALYGNCRHEKELPCDASACLALPSLHPPFPAGFRVRHKCMKLIL